MKKYPTSNGKQWDRQRKQQFNYWLAKFQHQIRLDSDNLDLPINPRDQHTLAWNCACHVVTANLR